MAECGLTDEDLSLFVFNYLAEGAEPQSGCGASAEDRLYSDFPEIDLSQLDVNDLDTGSCLGELQWDSEQSDISSSHYSTDGSELFQIIEEENEALLAALTATLGDIAVDDVSLSAFGVEAEQLGAVSSPAPPVSQPDEASLVRNLPAVYRERDQPLGNPAQEHKALVSVYF
uniref:Peroxisome proliferator-activated receptor gamma coactivator 1-beta-like n=1 Tax=Callorhinchus milii TaxID=7868 RepID=A0A4W3KJA3_CALMI